MPNFAYLNAEIKCPACGVIITDLIGFGWGYCPGQLPRGRKGQDYRIGDAIYWRSCNDGRILPWTGFGLSGSNAGDPLIKNLIALDEVDWLIARQECDSSCPAPRGGIAIEIRDDIIKKAWAYPKGEFEDEAKFPDEEYPDVIHSEKIYFYSVEEDGTIKPRADWQLHSFSHVEDC